MQTPAVRPRVGNVSGKQVVPPVAHQRAVLTAASHARAESPPIHEPTISVNRRALFLLAAGAAALSPLGAYADDAPPDTSRVFFDVAIDRKPAGRIVVEVDRSAARVGAQRFLDLVS